MGFIPTAQTVVALSRIIPRKLYAVRLEALKDPLTAPIGSDSRLSEGVDCIPVRKEGFGKRRVEFFSFLHFNYSFFFILKVS